MLGSDVHTNEIPILEVESVQLVARLLCIHYVLIDHEGSAFGVICDSLADLAVVDQFLTLRRCAAETNRMGPNLPNRSKSSSTATL